MATTQRRKKKIAREQKRKGRALLAVTKDELGSYRKVTISVSGLESLQIDKRYQRGEVRPWVYALARTLEDGGQQLDPIVVAERADGSRWIVDGQQRWKAHRMAGIPIEARVYRISSFDVERKLFLDLNHRRALPATNKVMAWPGCGSQLIEWLNTSDESALKGDIATVPGVKAKCPASTVAKWMLTLLTGSAPSKTEDVMSLLNEAIETNKPHALKRAEMIAVIIANVFRESHIPALAPRAIALSCRQHWNGITPTVAFPMPNKRQIGRLRRYNWTEYGNSNSRLPILVLATQKMWPAK